MMAAMGLVVLTVTLAAMYCVALVCMLALGWKVGEWMHIRG